MIKKRQVLFVENIDFYKITFDEMRVQKFIEAVNRIEKRKR
jgi:hypothetical protein